MTSTTPDGDQPWVDDLRAALADRGLRDAGALGQRAALRLAEAIGNCRLHGAIIPAELDGVLPVAVAMAAAQGVEYFVDLLLKDAQRLGEHADELPSPELEVWLQGVLAARKLVWAVIVALDEADWEHRTESLHVAIERAVGAIQRVDDVLTTPENLIVLSVVTDTPALENARRSLAPEFRERLPWWLDGTLEATRDHLSTWCNPKGEQSPGTTPLVKAHSTARLAAFETEYSLAARAVGDEPVAFDVLVWNSPDGAFRAMLVMPPKLSRDEVLVLSFWLRDGQRATALAGQSCWLAGSETQIDDKARAQFAAAEIVKQIQQGQQLVVQVGTRDSAWLAEGV